MSEKKTENNEYAYEQELRTDLDDHTRDKPKGMALHTKILLGLVVGAGGGVIVNYIVGGTNENLVWFIKNFTEPIGQLFLNLLLMIVVPLVFSSLIVGVVTRPVSSSWK
ncbi:MAG TPA: cation:dicarboxylase symporter family transporter [Pyrinomonadaceae bacterium]|nr:cation:dicarboxylase symporter family transporter [Pyrinomonadaceae bacterium]